MTNRKFDYMLYALLACLSAVLFWIMTFATIYATYIAYGPNASNVAVAHQFEIFEYLVGAMFWLCAFGYSISKVRFLR